MQPNSPPAHVRTLALPLSMRLHAQGLVLLLVLLVLRTFALRRSSRSSLEAFLRLTDVMCVRVEHCPYPAQPRYPAPYPAPYPAYPCPALCRWPLLWHVY